jgi:cyclophilin family peptidyl-prolyl cis-trans isomerase
MTTRFLMLFGLISVFAFSLFAQAQPAAPPPKAAAPAPPAREPGLYATLATTQGNITVKFFEKEAPITVKNFTDLARGRKAWTDPKTRQRVTRPLYNGLTFHRVIPGFMIQGGDPLGEGTGGTDVIPDEFHPTLKFDQPGRMAMANAGPRTGSCQFFFGEVPTPHLNGLHTIFGQVVEGMDVVSKIARVPRDASDKPRTPVRILKVSIIREGPAPAEPAKPAVKKAAPAAKPATPAVKKAAPAAKKAVPPAK